ncbi:GNAT family N-acetyltransferase [Desertimonas flava]|uniref:GNAT family N-acetyltransferase n=1 Tax=Desertimonas flava TaxID=2064846 RepID=UPI000E3512E2|nr:GNAT family N-acetyltransferase [Desertimonas flava]
MIDPVVRRARRPDAAALAELEAEARAQVATTRGGARWLDEHPVVGDAWPGVIDTHGVFVATIPADDGADGSDTVVGYIVAELRREAVNLVVVDQVFVHADARELGFGDELLAAAVEYGRQAGAALIEAHTLPGDRDIKNLYERAGITARLITVSKPL